MTSASQILWESDRTIQRCLVDESGFWSEQTPSVVCGNGREKENTERNRRRIPHLMRDWRRRRERLRCLLAEVNTEVAAAAPPAKRLASQDVPPTRLLVPYCSAAPQQGDVGWLENNAKRRNRMRKLKAKLSLKCNLDFFCECTWVKPLYKSIITTKEALLRLTVFSFSGQTHFQWEYQGHFRDSIKFATFKTLRRLNTTWNFARSIIRVSTHELEHWEHCFWTIHISTCLFR